MANTGLLPFVRGVDFTCNDFSDEKFPDAIRYMTGLQWLRLDKTNLNEVPEELGKLMKLENLSIKNNNLEKLFGELTELKCLRSLNVRRNRVKSSGIPAELFHLEELTTLDLSHNRLKAVPEGLDKAKSLLTLHMRNTQRTLANLPTSLDTLSNLSDVDLSKNALTKVPDALYSLLNLKRLNLSDNEITEKQTDKSTGHSLQAVEPKEAALHGNPDLVMPPKPVERMRGAGVQCEVGPDSAQAAPAPRPRLGRGARLGAHLTWHARTGEHTARRQRAAAHQRTQDTGQTPGLQVWEIENFIPAPVEEVAQGKFFEGECYIILKTSVEEQGQLTWDIHFWIGSKATLDKGACAAMHAVNLRNLLGAKRTQRHEQGDESEEFLALFPTPPVYIQGSHTASGFFTVDEPRYVTRLYRVHAHGSGVHLVPVEVSAASLDARHVYGKKAKNTLKSKARLFSEKINKEERKNKAELVAEPAGKEPRAFWQALGYEGEPFEHVPTDFSWLPPRLYRVELGMGYLELPQPEAAPLARGVLATRNVYILDTHVDVTDLSALFTPRQPAMPAAEAKTLADEWNEDLEAMEAFVLEGRHFVRLPDAELGVFYTADCYVFLCRYILPAPEDESESSVPDEESDADAVTWVVYFWQGRRAPNMGWLTFTFGLERKFKQLCKRLDVVRTHQQQESLKFMSHFHRNYILNVPLEGGSSASSALVYAEPDNFFWVALGGRKEYDTDADFLNYTRLFRCSNEKGYFIVSEKCTDFCQVFLWLGAKCSEVEIKLAYKSAQVYIQHMKTLQPDRPRKLFLTLKNKESRRFTKCFHGWGEHKRPPENIIEYLNDLHTITSRLTDSGSSYVSCQNRPQFCCSVKATHESLPCPDALALEAFCSVMRDAAEGPQLAAQALSARIHTLNAREALLALSTVDRCMRKCGPAFHAEIGKFRFLNEMIKLVSPKYFANRTAPDVQIKLNFYFICPSSETIFQVLQLLHAWSIEYPKESKFKVAYEMLKNQGVIKETPPPLPPEDVVVSPRNKHAIFEDEEKSKLLQKLLQSKKPEDLQHANRLIKKDILTSIDQLDAVGEMYKQFMAEKKTKKNSSPRKPTNSESLLDFAGVNAPSGDGDKANVTTEAKSPAIDELGDIFSAKDGPTNIAEPLKPVNLMSNGKDSEKANKTEGWNELDSLGEQLLKQSLPDNAKRVDTFNSKPVKKIPMKELEKSSPKHSEAPKNDGEFDLDFFTKKPEERVTVPKFPSPLTPTDDVMVDIRETGTAIENKWQYEPNKDFKVDTKRKPKEQDKNTVEPLTDITVDVKNLVLSEVPPMTVFKEEGGVTVTLEFCKDKPRDDVSIVIVVTTNNGQHDIEDYKFQPVVPKGCKVRLLPASGSALARYNPYEAPALRQPALVARPRGRRVPLKFVVTYVAAGEPCSEMGEVDELPLDLI
ncbi:hypothetical protein MSG28_010385 [Choristoneura fumiferana]|uniref:Uncharacterized protein n=1 Tax=Choristoneura fumiferana TaxID=7141 RepID=A0ACC0KL40_CHOFU|nr:hypothetical protein MSG28_010385 [Choristoneura fumiferana]